MKFRPALAVCLLALFVAYAAHAGIEEGTASAEYYGPGDFVTVKLAGASARTMYEFLSQKIAPTDQSCQGREGSLFTVKSSSIGCWKQEGEAGAWTYGCSLILQKTGESQPTAPTCAIGPGRG